MKILALLCSFVTVIPAAQLQGKVVGVKEGNAIEILKDGKVFEVRLYGVDCPAKVYAKGMATRHFVVEKTFMNDIAVELLGAESDGTLIGNIILADGSNLNQTLIRKGLAWWDKQTSSGESNLAVLEKAAREAYLGVWASSIEEDEDDIDFGKEVLVKREMTDKANLALTASAAN